MSDHPSLLEQFRSFYFQNRCSDIEQAIEYFSVFGGMGWHVDMSKSLDELIETKILKNYRYIHGDITKITQSNKLYHSLLTALATGDGREHAAFKKARIGRHEGEEAIDSLIDFDLLYSESPQAKPVDKDEEVADRLHFNLPFMRFWFAFVSPYYKGIKAEDYKEFNTALVNKLTGFSDPIYEALFKELIKQEFKDDPIKKIGAYWDKTNEIPLLGKTVSGKIIAGSYKTAKSKSKKTELNKLQTTCKAVELKADIYALFSKQGFSSELKNEKNQTLRLFTLKHLKSLLNDLSVADLIENQNKKY